MKKKKRVVVWILFLLIVNWVACGVTDYLRVSSFEKPLFSLPVETADDGGSGHYVGLGYAFDIKGNFLPESEYPGVTEYTYLIFGTEVMSAKRD